MDWEIPVYIVDDDQTICWILAQNFQLPKKPNRVFESAEKLLDHADKLPPGVFLVDIDLPKLNGLSLIPEILARIPSSKVIIMTGYSSLNHTVSALNSGAFDFISKPFELDEIEIVVERAKKEIRNGSKSSIGIGANDLTSEVIIGGGKSITEVFKKIANVSKTETSVLILGESGTGKELVAREIHKNSNRKGLPFVAINCAAIPAQLLESELFGHKKGSFTGAVADYRGKFLSAGKGTIFLDEIGDMPMELQAKLLRVIQEKEFQPIGSTEVFVMNAKIISATNKTVEELLSGKSLRKDLFYRLNVFNIELPPLRERGKDVGELIDYFAKKYEIEMNIEGRTFSNEAFKKLVSYGWPGNVRELQNTVKFLLISCNSSVIEVEDLPVNIKGNTPQEKLTAPLTDFREAVKPYLNKDSGIYNAVVGDLEKVLFKEILKETNGNKIKAASILGINRNTLSTKLKKHKIR